MAFHDNYHKLIKTNLKNLQKKKNNNTKNTIEDKRIKKAF